MDDILYFVDQKKDGRQRVVLPKQLQRKVMEVNLVVTSVVPGCTTNSPGIGGGRTHFASPVRNVLLPLVVVDLASPICHQSQYKDHFRSLG